MWACQKMVELWWWQLSCDNLKITLFGLFFCGNYHSKYVVLTRKGWGVSTGSQASCCELMALMAVRAPTVNRDLAGVARRRAKNGHSPTIRVRRDSQLFGGNSNSQVLQGQFTTSRGQFTTLFTTFGGEWRSLQRDHHSHGATSLFTLRHLLLPGHFLHRNLVRSGKIQKNCVQY